jgi:hypothetical protein
MQAAARQRCHAERRTRTTALPSWNVYVRSNWRPAASLKSKVSSTLAKWRPYAAGAGSLLLLLVLS